MTATVLITGATSGIGREAAVGLAEGGATVLFTGRDREAGQAVLSDIESAHPDATGEFYRADFADFDAVREVARDVRSEYDHLDVLINNAGTSQSDQHTVEGGVELTFAVNHLAPFLLTNLLAPLLRESAPARVITTSSALHENGSLSDLDAVIRGETFDGMDAYADSKLANVLFTVELADRLDGTGVTANCFHPGWIPETGLVREANGVARVLTSIGSLVAKVGTVGPLETVEGAGETLVYLAKSPDVASVSGAYFDQQKQASPAEAATDKALRERLWKRSAELVGVPVSVPECDPLD